MNLLGFAAFAGGRLPVLAATDGTNLVPGASPVTDRPTSDRGRTSLGARVRPPGDSLPIASGYSVGVGSLIAQADCGPR